MSTALATLIDRSRREREDWRYTDLEKLLKAIEPPSRLREGLGVGGELAPLRESDHLDIGTSPPSFPPASGRDELLPSSITDVSQRQRILFVNGVWQPDQTQFGSLPSSILQGDAKQGYRLVFAGQSCLVSAPLELVFVQTDESRLSLAIEVGSNASVTIIEHHAAEGGATGILESAIHLQPQAKLVHKKITHNNADAALFSRSSVRVEAGAYYRSFDLIKNTRVLRSEIDVTLAGPLAQCGLDGVMLLQGREHADLQTRVHHQAPHGTSRQLYKAVVKDQARGVFQGRIHVAEGAQKTDGRQLCRALLLSDQAEMDAKPELEIYADDVACSHGCAVGDLDAEAMFYLRTRGLNENEARQLLMRAFIDEVIDTIQVDATRAYIGGLAGGWMQ